MKNFWEWMEEIDILLENVQYISSKEYEDRLLKLGWRIKPIGSHRRAFAPDGIGIITWSANNWEKNWHQIARDLLRFAKGGRTGKAGYTDLEFIFKNPFQVPANFDYKTQEIKDMSNSLEIMSVSKLLNNPGVLMGKEVKVGDSWKRVELADHGHDGMSVDVMFDDSSTVNFPRSQVITMRMVA